MNRKRALVFGGALAVMISAAGGVYFYFGSEILSHIPFLKGDKTDVNKDHAEQEGNGVQNVQHASPGENRENEHGAKQAEESNQAEAADTHEALASDVERSKKGDVASHSNEEPAGDGHGASGAAKEKDTELLPASDYVAPRSRSSAAVNAIREMSRQQTRMANGNKDAPKALKELMQQIPQQIAEIDLQNPSSSEIQAVALYVLSGGDPSVTDKLLKGKSLSEKERSLLTGVASYAKADFVKASEALSHLVVTEFETTLAAQLSLAQAQASINAQAKDNAARLKYAANVVPGTLIEEAAIRRLVPILADIDDGKQYSYWAQRYLRKYPSSLYYQDFEDSLIATLSRMIAGKSAVDETIWAEILATAREDRAASIAHKLLLKVILAGSEEKCDIARKAIMASYDLKSESFRSSDVLLTICGSMEGTNDEFEALKSIDVTKLDEEVKQHLAKALAMANAMLDDIPPVDEASIGPNLPLAADEIYAPLFASVAQQIDASVSAIRKVDEDETGSSR